MGNKLTLREKGALRRINNLASFGYSLASIRRKLNPRYSRGELDRAVENFLFDNKTKIY